MKFLSYEGLTHLKLLIKNALAKKSDTEHKHTKSDITDYTEYSLPTASTDVLGGVKVGAGLSISQGVLSATGGGTADSVDWSNVQNRPNKLSEFTNDSNFVTETFVTSKGYQTASDVESKINNKISSVMKYKGTVSDYSSLPNDAIIGDTYNITNSSANNKAGDNACWNGTSWDILSGTIDLSNYVQNSDLIAITNSEIDTIWEA